MFQYKWVSFLKPFRDIVAWTSYMKKDNHTPFQLGYNFIFDDDLFVLKPNLDYPFTLILSQINNNKSNEYIS